MLSGQWVTLNTPVTQVPIVGQRDPQHATPDPTPEYAGGMRPGWASSAPAPDLPAAIMPTEHPPLTAPGGPVDYTPADHAYGPGASSGDTLLGGQDVAAPWHALDQGDYAARKYISPPMRETNPQVDEITDMADQGDSPRTLEYDRTGFGVPSDPAARLAKRIRRMWQRPWDMHRYEVQLRPLTVEGVRAQVVQDNRYANQTTPPNPSILGYDPRTPDRFVTPFARRAPSAWDETSVRDGTGQPAQVLPVWGM